MAATASQTKAIQDAWNKKSATEQAAYLKSNPAFATAATQYGLVSKPQAGTNTITPPASTNVPKVETPKATTKIGNIDVPNSAITWNNGVPTVKNASTYGLQAGYANSYNKAQPAPKVTGTYTTAKDFLASPEAKGMSAVQQSKALQALGLYNKSTAEDPMVSEAKTGAGTNYTAPNGKVYNIKVGADGKASFVSQDGSNATKSFNSLSEAMDTIQKNNPKVGGAIETQKKVDKNADLSFGGMEPGRRPEMPDAEAWSAMTPDEQAMWLQKADQAQFIDSASKTFSKFATDTIKGQAEFKDAVNQKQKLLSDQLNMNVQNRANAKAQDDANWKKIQDQVDSQVKAQKEKLDMMEKEFIKGQAEAKGARDDYSKKQQHQADIETAGESAGAAANLSSAGLSGSAIANATAGIADKNHKRYVDLAKTNFDTAQALTKQYTDFYNSLVNQMGNVDATQRGVMETIAQNTSKKIEDLKTINQDYIKEMADPLHKFIDAQTSQYTTQAGDTAKIKANIAAWDESDSKAREELVVNNLVRLAGDTPGVAVQLKSISPAVLQAAIQQPTLIQALQALTKAAPALASAIKANQANIKKVSSSNPSSNVTTESNTRNGDSQNNNNNTAPSKVKKGLDEIFSLYNK